MKKLLFLYTMLFLVNSIRTGKKELPDNLDDKTNDQHKKMNITLFAFNTLIEIYHKRIRNNIDDIINHHLCIEQQKNTESIKFYNSEITELRSKNNSLKNEIFHLTLAKDALEKILAEE